MKHMEYTVGSCFAGMGGFDLAFHNAGYRVAWSVEIKRWCRDLLAQMNPPTAFDPKAPVPIFNRGSQIISAANSHFPDSDYIILKAGTELVKIMLVSFEEFMRRWKRDGEELAVLIERLRSY